MANEVVSRSGGADALADQQQGDDHHRIAECVDSEVQEPGRRPRSERRRSPGRRPVATLKPADCSATAEGIIIRGTRSGSRACQVGRLSATPTPSTRPSPRSKPGVIESVAVKIAIARADAPMITCAVEHQLGPIEHVGESAGGEGEEEKRQGARGDHQPDPGVGSGQFEHEPGASDALDEAADRREQRSDPQRAE